jgi:hypothetical protein
MLRKEFKKILILEKRAKVFYDHYVDLVNDKDIRERLAAIRDDEVRHIEIAQKLVDYVS